MGLPVTVFTPAQVIELLARIFVLPASVPPPDVFMNVNKPMLKLGYQADPLFAIHGEISMENLAFGKEAFKALTSAVILVPATAGDQGCVCPLIVYWYQSGSISKMMGRPPRQAAKPVELLV